ncbi:hypothetical protein PoB_002303600 [Plakobranchus ocellatus]|uniref:Uncharacterized protein n=1 Tax=Plakobranchus ocellatus TaxID=259542 RepID=A0AAV3ZB83_9GAST|nr:hypothetical protein PoB_002303600 [Plakobranchus ocellatus]
MLMTDTDSHYCRAITTLTCRIHPSPHRGRTSWQTRRPHCGGGLSTISSTGGLRWIEVVDSRRRSRQDDSAGKEVGGEDKDKMMSPMYQREAPSFNRLLRHAQYSGSILSQTPHGKRKK